MKYLFLLLFISMSTMSFEYYVIENSSVPLQVHNDKSNPGIVTETLQACFKGKYNTQSYPFSRLIKELELEKRDWINFGSPSWYGIQSVNLSSEPILSTKHYFVALKSSKIKELSNIKNKKVILVKGFEYPGLKEFIKKNNLSIFYVKSVAAAIKAIELKRGDIFPEMDFRLFYHINKSSLELKELNFVDISSITPETTIHFSFSKNFPIKTINELNRCVARLKKVGTIAQIKNRYHFESIGLLR